MKINDGIYFLHPEGGAWIGAQFRDGELQWTIYEANAATHCAANDRWAGIVPSDDDCDVSHDLAAEIVRQVIGDEIILSMVAVQRAN